MNKNTLTFERKLYVAPACKTHVLQIEEGILVVSDPNAVRSDSASSGYDSEYELDQL